MTKLNIVLCLALFAVAHANPIDEPIQKVGGFERITDEQSLTHLNQNITKHLEKLGAQENGPHFDLVKINSAEFLIPGTHKTAAVLKHHDKEVDCTVWLIEQPWLSSVRFEVDCGDGIKHEWNNGAERTRRSLTLGGSQPASRTDLDELETKLIAAFRKYAIENPSWDGFGVKRVIDGTYKVVAGTIYDVNMEISVAKSGNIVEYEAHVTVNPEGKIIKVIIHTPGHDDWNRNEFNFN